MLWLPGPASYSGEDSAELHLHAGRAVIDGVSDALVASGTRPAEAGEFTRRAFLNGKMDLLEAEAVVDLVSAETAAQRRQALRQLEGTLGDLYRGWSERLRRMLAHQEALIDFVDEDLPPETERAMVANLGTLRGEIAAHLADGHRGERVREGLVFAVTGPPNVGKSTLVNLLVGRDVAIVTPVPGTTRDPIEARIELGGVPITLVDTAGIRETRDVIEAEGVRRACQQVARADLVLALCDARDPGMDVSGMPASRVIRVASKFDLASCAPAGMLAVSAHSGAGIAELCQQLAEQARVLTGIEGPPPLTRARHRAALRSTFERLGAAEDAAWPELRAEDLRVALRALGGITGDVRVEDILDTIFGQFCIGK